MTVTLPTLLNTPPDTVVQPPNGIVVTSNPKGMFLEGVLREAARPGVHLQIVASGTPVGNRLPWELYDVASDGLRSIVALLLENSLLGVALQDRANTTLDALVAVDTQIRLYCPIMGEVCLVRVAKAGTGPADAIHIGDKFMIDDGTGLAIAVGGSEQSAPWQAVEAVADVPANGILIRCMYTGH